MRNGSESDMCFHGPCIQHARVLSRLVIEMVTNSPPAKSSISGECILCILACVNMALAVGPSPASSTPIRPPRVWSLSAHGESFDDAPQLPFLIQTSFLKMKKKKLITD